MLLSPPPHTHWLLENIVVVVKIIGMTLGCIIAVLEHMVAALDIIIVVLNNMIAVLRNIPPLSQT